MELPEVRRFKDARWTAKITGKKLVDVRQRIQDLSMLDAALATLVQRCSTSKGKVSCPLIDTLMNGGELTQ
ncbi:MerR family transcriptional regulator [Paraburkholderia elongata]|uniref:Uncharacterized protein n=1 Tax=Paraburkholderia elongata TaxID=2675747 RepID=A0A972NLB3_9BURK|nr:hypothetical protein [Paraburkholderia elongata]NPT54379.1 hypothetical protein [Paraburkholderia elongata]